MKNTIAGVDLAKNVIEVFICIKNKMHSNTWIARHGFLTWLFKSKSMIIMFAESGTSSYKKKSAIEAGHDARLVSAELVEAVRKNQKVDKSDALAIACH